MNLRFALMIAAFAALAAGTARAQSNPGFVGGVGAPPLTAAALNAALALKMDVANGLMKANNLGDVPNPAAARVALGLGNAATLNVGTTAGTVMAGDDSRIAGAVQAANNGTDFANLAATLTNLGGLAAANNLADVPNPSAARVYLGLGSLATQNASSVAVTGGTISGADVSSASVLATGSTYARTPAARAADVANVLDFHADPTGMTDSTLDFQQALATNKAVYVPCGTYHITNSLTVAANGAQRLYGDGACSVISIGPDFNSAASGVIVLSASTSLQAAMVDDLQIAFSVPPDVITTANGAGSGNTVVVASAANIAVGQYIYDTNNSGNNLAPLTTVTGIAGNTLTLSSSATSVGSGNSLHFAPSRAQYETLAQGCTTSAGGTGCKYPWAIYGIGATGAVIENLTVAGAWDGIDFSKGTYLILNNRVGALDQGLLIDGSGDSGTVNGFKFEHLGWIGSTWDATFQGTFEDGSTTCLNAGRTDGGQYIDIQCFIGNVNILPTFTYGVFHALNLNGIATFNEEAGVPSSSQVAISGLFANTGGASGAADCVVNLQGSGSVSIGSPAIYGGGSQTDLCVGAGRAVVTGGILANPGGTSNAVVASETGGDMMLEGTMVTNANQQSVAPINISGGTYHILANVVNSQGVSWETGATVPFVNITASCTGSNANVVALNASLPGNPISGACNGFAWPNSDMIAQDGGGASGTITMPTTPSSVPIQSLNTVGNATLLVGQLFAPMLTRNGTQTANFTDTTPTAAAIVAYFVNPVSGSGVKVRFLNTTSFTETLAGGTGVTITGTATIAAGTWRDFYIIFTNVTSGSEAIKIENMGGGTL